MAFLNTQPVSDGHGDFSAGATVGHSSGTGCAGGTSISVMEKGTVQRVERPQLTVFLPTLSSAKGRGIKFCM